MTLFMTTMMCRTTPRNQMSDGTIIRAMQPTSIEQQKFMTQRYMHVSNRTFSRNYGIDIGCDKACNHRCRGLFIIDFYCIFLKNVQPSSSSISILNIEHSGCNVLQRQSFIFTFISIKFYIVFHMLPIAQPMQFNSSIFREFKINQYIFRKHKLYILLFLSLIHI